MGRQVIRFIVDETENETISELESIHEGPPLPMPEERVVHVKNDAEIVDYLVKLANGEIE